MEVLYNHVEFDRSECNGVEMYIEQINKQTETHVLLYRYKNSRISV
jgi:hypothetical protein